jgi:WD40 repeat protein
MIASSCIDASLTTQSLTFRPGGASATFGVSVLNRSDRFASFQLEILAAGASEQTHWYELSPEVSTAKSPGDRTDFQVRIVDSPLPNFVGTVNLLVRVFSPQLSDEKRLVLRLTLEPGGESDLLHVGLPSTRFQVYPRNLVEVPVTIKNLRSQSTEIYLSCLELEPTWLLGSTERRIEISANQEAIVIFKCQPPGANQVASQDYPFTIVARSREGSTAETKGILEILPVGFMQFEAQPHQQRLPAKRPWLPNWKARSASFQLLFQNNSNLLQTVDLEIRGQDVKRCRTQIEPENADLPLGKITPVDLTLFPRRPWIGWARTLKFEVKPWLSDPRLGSPDPATQILFLKVFPILPLWLLLTLLSMVLYTLFKPTPISHLASVNAVQLSGTSGRLPLVFSASDDCSMRSWGATDWITLQPQGVLRKEIPVKTCTVKQPGSPQGFFSMTQQAIRSLALVPVKNNQVFAGLENGTIQVWDVNSGLALYALRDPADQTSDRSLDLAFTRNGLTLYSGYGSGTIRSWQRPQDIRFPAKPAKTLKLSDRFAFQVWSLALNADEKLLVSAGQFKRLVIWDVSKSKPTPRQLKLEDAQQTRGENDFFWDVDFAPNAPLLAAADSDGFITLWDFSQCTSGFQAPRPTPHALPEQHCQQLARWRAAKKSVRQIRFTADQRWLVSAGDDGRIMAWPLTNRKILDPTQKPEEIASLPSRVTSLDLITNEQGVWVASGSVDAQVRLHRFSPDE